MNAGFSNLDTLKKTLLPGSAKSDTRFDLVIAALGRGVAAQFGSMCNRQFMRVVGDTAIFSADRCEFIVPRYPLESVSLAELKITETDGWVTQTDPNFIRALNLIAGIINCGPEDAGPYYAQVRFTYTGGFFWETLEPDDAAYPSQLPSGAAPLPDDLFNAWLLQCRHVWSQMDKLGTDLLKGGADKNIRTPDDLAAGVKITLTEFIRFTLV